MWPPGARGNEGGGVATSQGKVVFWHCTDTLEIKRERLAILAWEHTDENDVHLSWPAAVHENKFCLQAN